MCIRVAVDLKLFHLIAEHGGPITAAQLAVAAGAEEQLLGAFGLQCKIIYFTDVW